MHLHIKVPLFLENRKSIRLLSLLALLVAAYCNEIILKINITPYEENLYYLKTQIGLHDILMT